MEVKKLKTINLISESLAFKEHNFSTAIYYGKETVCFNVFEKEFIFNSTDMKAFDMDLNELPYYSNKYDSVRIQETNAGCKQYYCPNEFYLIVNKGNIGYESNVFAAKVSVTEIETEFIVRISLVRNSEENNKAIATYINEKFTVTEFCSEHFFHRLNDTRIPVSIITEKVERTAFLDIGSNQYAIPVKLNMQGDFELDIFNQLRHDGGVFITENSDKTLKIGDYLYRSELINSVEIVQVISFAHSVYGSFYAVAESRYLYPQDKERIQAELPNLYKNRCMSSDKYKIKKILENAEIVSYIPTESRIGDNVIYQKICSKYGYPGISTNVFHFMYSDFYASFYSQLPHLGGSGLYENTSYMRAEQDSKLAALIQINGRFKIVVYNVSGYVKYKDEYYVKLEYVCVSPFIDDLNDYSKNKSILNDAENDIDFDFACRNAQYLLCRNKIKPIKMTIEDYDFLLE